MLPSLPELSRKLATLGFDEAIAATRIDGGDISVAWRVTLRGRQTVFVKTNDAVPPDFFQCEAEGLYALRQAAALRVPEVLAVGAEGIVLEWVAPGAPGADFWERFGRSFASLHRRTAYTRFGFYQDGYLGRTPQLNAWMKDGVAFWRDRRLGFQLQLAREKGLASSEMMRLGERLLARLDTLLPDEAPCLVHGDLWSGNFLVGPAGEPVFFDPAAYYGHREADLAMTHLFGGFAPPFYAAYEEAFPLLPGAAERRDLYGLYYLLNHLNLFGRRYEGSVMEVLRKYA